MKTPEWVKPGIYGAFAGAIALAVVGFGWGGWVTDGTARKMASAQARLEVTTALLPICIAQSSKDPQLVDKLARLKAAQSYERDEMVMKTGWATMPGTTDPNRQVATACLEKLATTF